MKKLLVLLLILMLSFSMSACGNSDEPDVQQNPAGSEQTEGEDESGSEEGETDQPDKLNPDDLIMGEDALNGGDSMTGTFEFDAKISEDFAMSGTIAKVDYSKLSSHASTMESMLKESADKVFGEGFDVFSDYEEDANDSIDKLAYAVGMENSDSEASYLEAGVYHDDVYDKHFQYTVYTSENGYEFDSAFIKTALQEMKDAYGVTVSQNTAEKAVKKVLEEIEKTQDYYSLYETSEVKGSGYAETVTVSVEGFFNEDGSKGFYMAVERERCYE